MYGKRCILITTALLLGATSGSGQQPGGQPRRPTRVPVTLVMADTPTGQPYRIVRRGARAPHDVVIFAAGADSAALSDAVNELLLLRQVQGDTVTDGADVLRVRGRGGARVNGRPMPWAGGVMRDLNAAARQEVPGFGTPRTVIIWLPPQRPRSPR